MFPIYQCLQTRKLFRGGKSNSSQAGMTLLEVMASVVILSVFAGVLLKFLTQMTTFNYTDDGEQTALMIARQTIEQLPNYGGYPTTNQIPYTTNPNLNLPNGYSVSVLVSDTGSFKVPQWAKDKALKYVEVQVTWNPLINGKQQPKMVKLDATLPQ
jgi:prepilin-type N-terminal cleavage/methylation domain-containing protein